MVKFCDKLLKNGSGLNQHATLSEVSCGTVSPLTPFFNATIILADNNLLFNNSTEGDPHLSNDGYTFLSSKIIVALKNGVRVIK